MVKKYLLEADDDLWKAFKIVTALLGLKVKEALPVAIQEFVKNHEPTQLKISFKVVEDRKKNLLTFIYETELKAILEALVDAKKRKAPPSYMKELKDRMLEIVKKHPTMPPQLADEIVQVFKQIP